ncbi:MAG TPA: hypothetical protein DCZ48_07255 [Methylococcaceae bacterium]|nr:hypothetical protein [Methylococcaceae bacterium]
MKFRLKSIKSRLTLLLLTIAVMGFGPYETYNYIQTKQRLHDELGLNSFLKRDTKGEGLE